MILDMSYYSYASGIDSVPKGLPPGNTASQRTMLYVLGGLGLLVLFAFFGRKLLYY